MLSSCLLLIQEGRYKREETRDCEEDTELECEIDYLVYEFVLVRQQERGNISESRRCIQRLLSYLSGSAIWNRRRFGSAVGYNPPWKPSSSFDGTMTVLVGPALCVDERSLYFILCQS